MKIRGFTLICSIAHLSSEIICIDLRLHYYQINFRINESYFKHRHTHTYPKAFTSTMFKKYRITRGSVGFLLGSLKAGGAELYGVL